MIQLYNKSKLLRSLNMPVDQQAPPPEPPKNPKDTTAQAKRKSSTGLHGLPRTAAQLLTMIKRIGATYSEGASTFIPGYMDSTQFLGQNLKSNEPGFDFVFGRQPDLNWLQDAAKKGLISRDPFLNNLFRQTLIMISLTASLEPVRDFAIDPT
jgi:cell surface protein SprA